MRGCRNLSAAILAGGKNTRIGCEKSLLLFDNRAIIKNALCVLSEVFKEVYIVSSKPELIMGFPGVPFIRDEYNDSGPLAGIHIALKKTEKEGVFIVACDMPFLNKGLIERQVEIFNRCRIFDVVVPSHKKGLEPLHSIYSKRSLPFIEAELREGNKAVRSFFGKVRTCNLPVREAERVFLFNINTVRDLMSARSYKEAN